MHNDSAGSLFGAPGDDAERFWVSSCHFCLKAIAAAAQDVFMLDDAVYCCASHRAAAAAAAAASSHDKRAAAGQGEPEALPSHLLAHKRTGCGLAASHRTWFTLDDLRGGSASPSTGSTAAGSRASSSPASTTRGITPLRVR